MRLLGAVLAGGRSTRFGSDKAVALWRGRRLIDHVIAALARECDAVVICGRDEPGYMSLADRPGPDLGPLGGLAAALAYAVANGFDRVLTAPCDTPLLPPDLAATLCAPGQARLVAALPVIGCWPAALSAALDAHLAGTTTRSIRGWADAAGAEAVAIANIPVNVNQESDLISLDRATDRAAPG